jgi:two-component system sensor histidine kinase BarA
MFPSKRKQFVVALLIIIFTVSSVFIFRYSSQELQLALFSLTSVLLLLILLYLFRGLQRFNNSQTTQFRENNNPDILVVDDMNSNRHFIIKILETISLTAIEADNGEVALTLLDKYNVKMIFMDINMDTMDGFETTRLIRATELINTRIPIIALSAHNSAEIKRKALLSGFDDYISKPVDETKLKSCIERWLDCNIRVTLDEPKEATKTTKNLRSKVKEKGSSNTQSEETKINSKIENKNASQTEDSLPTKPRKKVVDIKQSLIYSHNNSELAKEMLGLLIASVDNEKESIHKAFKDKDWPTLGNLVHKLNGGSCYCGVPELQKYTESIDKAIQQENYAFVEEKFSQLEIAMSDLLEWGEEHDLDIIFDP